MNIENIGALAFGIVVLRELAAIVKDVLAYAKDKNGNGKSAMHCTDLRDLRQQVSDIDKRLARLEGELDV